MCTPASTLLYSDDPRIHHSLSELVYLIRLCTGSWCTFMCVVWIGSFGVLLYARVFGSPFGCKGGNVLVCFEDSLAQDRLAIKVEDLCPRVAPMLAYGASMVSSAREGGSPFWALNPPCTSGRFNAQNGLPPSGSHGRTHGAHGLNMHSNGRITRPRKTCTMWRA